MWGRDRHEVFKLKQMEDRDAGAGHMSKWGQWGKALSCQAPFSGGGSISRHLFCLHSEDFSLYKGFFWGEWEVSKS